MSNANTFLFSEDEMDELAEKVGQVQLTSMAEKFAVAFIQKAHEHPSDAEILLIADASVRLAKAIKSRLQSEQTQGKPDKENMGSKFIRSASPVRFTFEEGDDEVHYFVPPKLIIDERYEILIPAGAAIEVRKL